MKEKPNYQVFSTADELAREAVDRFINLANQIIRNKGRFSVVLAGGSTPKKAYELLATEAYLNRVDWEKVYAFFGDERMVSLTNPESNYRLALEAFLSKVPIPKENIFAVETNFDPETTAKKYEEKITEFFNGDPEFDLVLLGIGPDGHTASLFPGQPEFTHPSDNVAVAVFDAPKPPPNRVSLTFKALNSSTEVLILVTGAEKAQIVKQIFESEEIKYPVQLIKPVNGSCTWLLDQEAAGLLRSR